MKGKRYSTEDKVRILREVDGGRFRLTDRLRSPYYVCQIHPVHRFVCVIFDKLAEQWLSQRPFASRHVNPGAEEHHLRMTGKNRRNFSQRFDRRIKLIQQEPALRPLEMLGELYLIFTGMVHLT